MARQESVSFSEEDKKAIRREIKKERIEPSFSSMVKCLVKEAITDRNKKTSVRQQREM